MKQAIFAGGCFWCMEYVFDKIDGVLKTVSGYCGGKTENPTYEEVSSGKTGHFEAILITYDEKKISYAKLLEFFWKNIDASDENGQFLDKGSQYKTAIFYETDLEKNLAFESKKRIIDSRIFGNEVFTQILPKKKFFKAEDYHQNYYKTCPAQFNSFHTSSGRERFALRLDARAENFRLFPEKEEYWLGYKKPAKKELKQMLSPVQFKVTQENEFEDAFNNEFYNFFEEGIYVDIVSREPLFSSDDKIDINNGFPTFKKNLKPDFILKIKDNSGKIQLKSKFAQSFLGEYKFDNQKNAELFVVNSASLFFIPKNELKENGYHKFLK